MSYTEAKARHYRKRERLRQRSREARDMAFKRAYDKQLQYDLVQHIRQLKGYQI